MITPLFGRVHFKTNYNYRLSNHCFINELILVTYALISNAVEKYHTNVVSKVSGDICNWPPIDDHLLECTKSCFSVRQSSRDHNCEILSGYELFANVTFIVYSYGLNKCAIMEGYVEPVTYIR